MAAEAVASETRSVEFCILGPLEVRRSGQAVPLGGPRQRAVLALLLLEANRVVSMDRLAEDVWGGSPPEGWATTLQTYVFHLRKALEPDRSRGAADGVLVTRDRGYLLHVDREHLDGALFQDGFTAGRAALEAGRYTEAAETLRKALGLWRSPVLADLADYAFTRPEAARLEELRLAALEARIDADLALGRHDALTAELEQLIADHPLRERVHGQLMLALYRCDRQADALAAYRRVRALLADELGIDPGEPLERLHAAVLAHDPALDWTGAPALADGQPADSGASTTAHALAPAPGGPGRRFAGTANLAWARRRALRLLVAGSALAVAAAACIVAVARPWAAEATGLPADSVGLIDSSGGRAGAPVPVGSPAGLAYGGGSVWAVSSADGTVSRINPATHAVQTIQVGNDPVAVAVTGQDAWVANSGDGTVSEINTTTNTVVQTIRVGNIPVAIASGPSGVWVANQGDDTVIRINPLTGAVSRPVGVGGLPDGIAVGPHAVWVANSQDGTVTKIDPATGQPSGPITVGDGPAGIAITPAAVWVANSLDLTVSRLDPATGRQTRLVGVGDGPGAIAAAKDGSIWVSDQFDATLDRIDPHTNLVTRRVPVGSSPQGIAVAGSGVWVAGDPFTAASHRGGTLTEVSADFPLQLDPVHDSPFTSTPALAGVYDGLVAFRKAGGVQGDTLVPDLARTLPRPAEGGTTYTFTLRRGIRYSNGSLVRASDFRRGLQRELSFGDNPPDYEGILGAQACARNPRRCDLAAGIVTNDPAGTVTFHLSQADPEFLYKLALLMAAPAPPGAANHLMDRAPFLPGTGPYMISRYGPDSSLTLVRNPHFRQWSYAAQPDGYPNVIRIVRMTDRSREQSAVAAGRADLVSISDDGLPYRSLAIQYPARVHPGLKLTTYYLFLNTRQPPFTSLKARQAINYAIDRGQIIRLFHLGSPGEATPTCQILPAGFPSYQRYCPYTAGAKDGAWHGPDLPKAKRLAHESGTTHVPVTVWISKNVGGMTVGSYLVGMLKDLGYRANMHTVPDPLFYVPARNKIQLGLIGWVSDIPSSSDFFLPVLTCRSTSDWNLGGFCDPHADQLVSKAQAAQQTDPAAARSLWAQADRVVTGQAAWAPIFDQSGAWFVSARVGNCQESPNYGGPLLDQMWVR